MGHFAPIARTQYRGLANRRNSKMKQRMGLAERSSAIWSTGRGIGLAAKERDGRKAPSSKLDGTGEEVAK